MKTKTIASSFLVRTAACALMTVMVMLAGPSSAWATLVTYDAAADFSSVNNPNGVWRYGYKAAGGTGPFTLFTSKFSPSGVDFWYLLSPPPFTTIPDVGHNPTAVQVIFNTAIVGPKELTFHPGPNHEDTVVRFLVPTAATYTIDALFEDRDIFANSAAVSVLHGSSVLFSKNLLGAPASFSQSLLLQAGDILDFQIDEGANSYFNDNKRLSVVIHADIPTAVPEPMSLLLLSIGCVAAFIFMTLGRSRPGRVRRIS